VPASSVSLAPALLPPDPSKYRAKLEVEPITDGAMIALNAGFAGLLDLVIGTGEIRPQQISPNFSAQSLLQIDRGAISQNPDPDAETHSNIGLALALSYAVIDPIASGFREKRAETALVDGIMYAEVLSVTVGVTNLAKIAVRRPRPIAYVAAAQHKNDPNYSNADTDSSLSFFSGHSSVTAAMSATATYLAFTRSPHTARPWITLIAGTALTSFVAVERVRAGKHFPTDVIAGAVAGAGIGVLVPHLHRCDEVKPPPVWIGAAPLDGTGGMVSLSGYV
jgi:undecaprenyl-diphosphatase